MGRLASNQAPSILLALPESMQFLPQDCPNLRVLASSPRGRAENNLGLDLGALPKGDRGAGHWCKAHMGKSYIVHCRKAGCLTPRGQQHETLPSRMKSVWVCPKRHIVRLLLSIIGNNHLHQKFEARTFGATDGAK